MAALSQLQTVSKEMAYWCMYDATYSLPAAIMLLNYTTLVTSEHPFFARLKQGNPLFLGLAVLYGSGVAFVLPKTYLIAYLAYGTTHLLIRSLRSAIVSRRVAEQKNEF
jgi:hypothetical protein